MKNRLLLTILLVTTLMSHAACGEKEVVEVETTRPIKAMKVGAVQPFADRWFPGVATATQEANLSFRVPGTVERLPIDIGTEVRQGDLLARLDPKDYLVDLNNDKAQLQKAVSGLELAKSEYARVARVYEKDSGAVSKSMVDVRKAELDSARAQVDSAKAAVESAMDNLSYTSLKSPFTGVVVEKFVHQFEDIQAGQPIIRILDTSSIEFTVQIPESLMKHIDNLGPQGATVIFDTYPDVEVPARIKEVGKEASKTTRTYPVTLTMEQPGGFTVLPGMAGKAKGNAPAPVAVPGESDTAGFMIPLAAIFASDGDRTFVWMINEQTQSVRRQEVNVIRLTEDGAMVTGIETGGWIATAGVNTLVEGQSIRILE